MTDWQNFNNELKLKNQSFLRLLFRLKKFYILLQSKTRFELGVFIEAENEFMKVLKL